MEMASAAPLAFNVSVPSDGLQGRSMLEKLMHKWLDGEDEARRLKYVLWGPGGVGKSTLALNRPSAAAGGCGWCSGYRLRTWSRTMRGCSTRCWARAIGGRRRVLLRRCVGGFTSCCSLIVRKSKTEGLYACKLLMLLKETLGDGPVNGFFTLIFLP